MVLRGWQLLRVLAFLVLGAGIAGRYAQADTIHLKRGGTMQGEAVEREATVEVRMSGGSTTFNREDVLRIEKNEAGIRHGVKSKSVENFKKTVIKKFNNVKRQADKSFENVKKKTSGWAQPIGKSKATT